MNVHAPTEDQTDDIKYRFYEELEHLFDKFLIYPMKMLLGDFNDKVRRKDILKPWIWNGSMGFVDAPLDNHSKKFSGPEKGRLFHRGRRGFTAVRLLSLAGDEVLRAPEDVWSRSAVAEVAATAPVS
jgi:hypothetical protein